MTTVGTQTVHSNTTPARVTRTRTEPDRHDVATDSRPISLPSASLDSAGLVQAAFNATDIELPCQNSTNPDLWFAEQAAALERAKQLCAQCPLMQECLASALQRGEEWGVWGGQILVEGQIVATKRGRGRPRKDSVAA